MALIRVSPLDVDVRCDWFTGRPRSIRLADEKLPVLAVARVRQESAAYPAATGPRTSFEVQTPAARLVISFLHRGRRWVVDGLVAADEPLPQAA